MTDDQQGQRRGRIKMRLAITTVVVILVLLIVPPYISINRYRKRITELISTSLGRPVRLSSVELRMLPRPSFVLTNLVVEEDPAYGAEPVLHANTVTASIRLLSLWRGQLRIDRISVDEASLNLVHTGTGRWNLNSLLRTASKPSATTTASGVPFPYLEATNSRINIKNGAEKLPYSLVNADISFWREDSGDWRVRLRGQPARTDVSLDLPDTGIVRLEATLRRGFELRTMPLHLDMDWREAQLGQLTRLLLGSDKGWRGDLTGEIHVDGTAESAQIKARLRASGVHRQEFAPASAMDFDATCTFVYHHNPRGMENVQCESPVGDGRVRLTGNAPPTGDGPHFSVELNRVPTQVALDTLRTVRSGIDPGLEADGAISGRLDYSAISSSQVEPAATPVKGPHKPKNRTHIPPPGPLTGSLNVTGLRLSGGRLSRPLTLPKVTINPAEGAPSALLAGFTLPAGGTAPLVGSLRMSLSGYSADLHGSASFSELRDFCQLGAPGVGAALQELSGPAANLEVHAEGPWVVAAPRVRQEPSANPPDSPSLVPQGANDQVSASIALHDAAWKAGFLPSPVAIASGTLHADLNGLRWNPISFVYGPLSGTASLTLPARCDAPDGCAPQFGVHFESLDAAALQAAILGARPQSTLFSSLMDRLRSSSDSGWPALTGSVTANSLVLGPVTLTDVSAALKVGQASTTIDTFSAGLLGGVVAGSGSVTPGTKPVYAFDGQFHNLQADEVGQLLKMTWSGEGLNGAGKVELSGFTDRELAASAKGTLHFEWRHGAITGSSEGDLPATLARFDRWTADAEIANNTVILKENQVQRGTRKASISGSAVFGDPPTIAFGDSAQARAVH